MIYEKRLPENHMCVHWYLAVVDGPMCSMCILPHSAAAWPLGPAVGREVLYNSDFNTLLPEGWLTGTVINYFIKFLSPSLPPPAKSCADEHPMTTLQASCL